MERLLQYWDDLDDMVGIFGLYAERIRRFTLFILSTLLFFLILVGGVMLALAKPPLALAAVTLLSVALMYHSVTQPTGLSKSA